MGIAESLFADESRPGTLRLRNYIGGEWLAPAGGEYGEVVNPATGEVYALCPSSSLEEADSAVAAAKAAFWGWRSTPLPDRTTLMFALRQKMIDATDELAEAITKEHGKTFREAKDELVRTLQYVEDACAVTQTMKGSFTEDIAHGVDECSVREPLGVFLILPPFNFPAMISTYFVWAVACGNTTVIKPSSLCPVTTHIIVRLAEEAGIPAGVVNVVNGGGSAIGDRLVAHPDVAGVSFVGSSKVGLHIYAAACARGKRAQVQGGAKNHVLVMPDAHMEDTVKNVAASCFGHVGERCFAVSNVLVMESVYDEFLERFLGAARELRLGDGMDPATTLGPVVGQRALRQLTGMIDQAVEDGANLLLDGRNPVVDGLPGGSFLGPTILEARPGMPIWEEEAFGPVRCIMKVKDLSEAIDVINASPYGHTAVIYTETGSYARSFSNRVNVGQVGVNIGTPAPIAFYAVGGRKLSFFGSTRGRATDAIDFYTDKKVVVSRWLNTAGLGVEAETAPPVWSPAAGLW